MVLLSADSIDWQTIRNRLNTTAFDILDIGFDTYSFHGIVTPKFYGSTRDTTIIEEPSNPIVPPEESSLLQTIIVIAFLAFLVGIAIFLILKNRN